MNKINLSNKNPFVLNAIDLSSTIQSAEFDNISRIISTSFGGPDVVVGYSPQRRGSLIFPSLNTETSAYSQDPLLQNVLGPSGRQYILAKSGFSISPNDLTPYQKRIDSYPIADLLSQPYFPRSSIDTTSAGSIEPGGWDDNFGPNGSFDHQPLGGPSKTFYIKGPISSRSKIRIVYAMAGSDQETGDLNIKDEYGNTVLDKQMEMDQGELDTTWRITHLDFVLPRRIPTQEVLECTLTFYDALSTGPLILGPVDMFEVYNDWHISALPLPTGDVLVHVDGGMGLTKGNKIIHTQPQNLLTDLSINPIKIYVGAYPQTSDERVLVTGQLETNNPKRAIQDNYLGIPRINMNFPGEEEDYIELETIDFYA